LRLRNILILLVILLALGGYFYFFNKPEPAPPPEPQIYVWMIEMDDIQRIEIRLRDEDQSQAFIKYREGDKFPWYFDDPQRSDVDAKRWGGGIPLLLSGPGANRVISENTSEEKLAEFDLIDPPMQLSLTLENGESLNINVGDSTPNGSFYYVQSPHSTDVALVDYTWYDVLERLVKEPPYVMEED